MEQKTQDENKQNTNKTQRNATQRRKLKRQATWRPPRNRGDPRCSLRVRGYSFGQLRKENNLPKEETPAQCEGRVNSRYQHHLIKM